MTARARPYGDGNLHIPDQSLVNRELVVLDQDVLKMIDDYAVAGTEYVGKAICGADVGSPVWQIQRMVTVANVDTITWADGDGQFDNIWANRAILTYK